MARPPVRVDITATDKTRKQFDSVSRRVQALQGGVAGLSRSFGGIGIGIAAFASAGILAIRAFNNSMIDTVNRLDRIDKAARNAGISPEVLQTWRLFGELGGATATQVDSALRRVNRRLGEALEGREVVTAFEQLGVAIRDVDGNARDVGPVLQDLAASLRDSDGSSQAFATALRIVDTEGANLIRALQFSNENFGEFSVRAREAGQILGGEVVAEAVKARDELTKMDKSLQAQADKLKTDLIPAWQTTTEFVYGFGQALVDIAQLGAALGKGFISTTLFPPDDIQDIQDDLDDLVAEVERVEGLAASLNDSDQSLFARGIRQGVIDAREEVVKFKETLDDAFAIADGRVIRAPAAPLTEEIEEAVDLTRELTEEDRKRIVSLTEAARLATAQIGTTAQQVELTRQRAELARDDLLPTERSLREELVNALEAQIEQTEAARQQAAEKTALANLEAQIAQLSGDTETSLLGQLGLTREQVAANEQLRQKLAELQALQGPAAIAQRAVQELKLQEQTNEALRQQIELHRSFGDITQEQYEALLQRLGLQQKIAPTVEEQVAAQLELIENQANFNAELEMTLMRMVAAGTLTQEQADRIGETLAQRDVESPIASRLEEDLREAAARGLESGFNAALESGDINDFFDSIGKQLLQALTQNAIQGIIGSFGGSGGSGRSGILGLLGGLFGGSRQQGGPVNPGQVFEVGEAGPEWFVPSVPGTVIPNGALGQVNVNVNQRNTVRNDADVQAIAQNTANAVARKIYTERQQGRF